MHELLHIKRRDIASELLSRLMRACYWFHPAAWFVSRQVTVTRELATDQDGRFRFLNLPDGYIAGVSSLNGDDWLASYVAVATSIDVPLGERAEKDRRMPDWMTSPPIVGTPFFIVADPGVRFEGVVVDDQKQPVSDAEVSFITSRLSSQTNAAGQFQLYLSSRMITDTPGKPPVPKSVSVQSKNPALLATSHSLTVDELEQRTPIQVELNRGYKVFGMVVSPSDDPCEGIDILVDSPLPKKTMATTDVAGRYEMYLPPGHYTLHYAANVVGYRLPTAYELRRTDIPADTPTPRRSVEITPGDELQVETVVVQTIPHREVLVVLPDGKPAERAALMVVDASESPGRNREVYTTDSSGLAKVILDGGSSGQIVGASYATSEISYNGQIAVDGSSGNAGDSPLRIELLEDSIIRGRVLVNGQPVAGAVARSFGYQITTLNNGAFGIKGPSGIDSSRKATTGADGRFEIRVPAGRKHGVTLESVPGIPGTPGCAPSVRQVSEGVFQVQDIEFKTGDGEIAGTVVGFDGRPLVGAVVNIKRNRDVIFENWLNHLESSQRKTDAEGRFVLRSVPEGE
jgi:uncharacterized GH25 family protein